MKEKREREREKGDKNRFRYMMEKIERRKKRDKYRVRKRLTGRS